MVDTAGLPDCFTGAGSNQCSGTPSFSDTDDDNYGLNDCCGGVHSDITTHYRVKDVIDCEPCE